MNTRYYKKYIEKLIATDPAEITLKRRVEVDDGYGGKTVSTVTHKERVIIYNGRSHNAIIAEGGLYIQNYTGMSVPKILSAYEADIQEGDTFSLGGYTYRVMFVKSFFDICKQMELEVVS